ncbi:DUF1295-domain-containing protein [Dacryopinax primogenitus]|uniref:DUF1295-domain-containing protein n=1 Tax=Dacryopinax primogenitus (strain DJM 731) TaxID=1858805 RepID=M5G3H2_DACPD|nr:DUF1295-domain-containing protein [Dacryopinax primogenitus]EJU04771.1 DUF1295-domain-containing protein [Dacryopinax primogenitus]
MDTDDLKQFLSQLFPPSSFTPYLSHPSLTPALYFCAFNILWTYVAGEITGNFSQVDRVWTFLPVIYTAWFTLWPVWNGEELRTRGVLMLALQITWMLRLSYNTFRRGLFSLSDEDYRWPIFRASQHWLLIKVFHFGFIAVTQNFLLLGIGLPAYWTLFDPPSPLQTSDSILSVLALLLLLLEFTADNQQYAYQSFKHSSGKPGAIRWPGARQAWTEADKRRGFVSRGLWAWSRHPNFACEQLFWFVQNLFPLLGSPTARPLLPSTIPYPLTPILPSLCLSLLFVASTAYTESITLSRYPEAYKAYQARVGKFSPGYTVMKWFWLGVTGKRERVERLVWGEAEEGEAKKQR